MVVVGGFVGFTEHLAAHLDTTITNAVAHDPTPFSSAAISPNLCRLIVEAMAIQKFICFFPSETRANLGKPLCDVAFRFYNAELAGLLHVSQQTFNHSHPVFEKPRTKAKPTSL